MYAGVLDIQGQPMTPTKNVKKMWYMVRHGRARVISMRPLVFQLLYETKFHVVSPCFVGLDLGRENIGCAVAIEKNGKLDIIHAGNCETENKKIPRRMKERKLARAARRRHRREKRKRRAKQCGTLLHNDLTRQYPGFRDGEIVVKGIRNKEPRFRYRERPQGWITPTVRHLVQAHVNLVKKLCKYYPITQTALEIPKFSFMRMEDGSIRGIDFQNGRLKGYTNVNEYVRARDHDSCVICGNPAEHIHHLAERSQNGSDLPENLVCLCKRCHEKVHHNKLSVESVFKKLFKKYHHLSILNVAGPYIYRELAALFGEDNVFDVSGYETSTFREQWNVPKDHWIDAIAVVCLGKNLSFYNIPDSYWIVRRFRRHNRQIVHKTSERTYKLNGSVIAKNRKARTGQKGLSVQEYYEQRCQERGQQEAFREISQMKVFPSKRSYNEKDRVLPGAICLYDKKIRIVHMKTATRYYVDEITGKRFPIAQSQLLQHNAGWCFIQKVSSL